MDMHRAALALTLAVGTLVLVINVLVVIAGGDWKHLE
jgi:hypothetical protein